MDDSGSEVRRIGAGPYDHAAYPPSPEWFPHFVTPDNYIDYWNDVDGKYRVILAAHWLADGLDSAELRWLAGLTGCGADDVTTEQMMGVLSSLGVAVESFDDFLARCGRAIARIQVDLDATGFGAFQMQAADASAGRDALPLVYAALPDGSWQASGEGMTHHMTDLVLLYTAAESISDVLMHLERVFWPSCVHHAGPPMLPVERKPDAMPVWRCDRGDHIVAPLGQLAARDIHPR